MTDRFWGIASPALVVDDPDDEHDLDGESARARGRRIAALVRAAFADARARGRRVRS